METKPTNAIVVNKDEPITRVWLEMTSQIHGLTDKEMIVATAFLDDYLAMKDVITNGDTLNNYIFSMENKKKIRLQLGMPPSYYQMILKRLRQKNFYVENRLNPKFVPSFNADGNIILAYIIKGDGKSYVKPKTKAK